MIYLHVVIFHHFFIHSRLSAMVVKVRLADHIMHTELLFYKLQCSFPFTQFFYETFQSNYRGSRDINIFLTVFEKAFQKVFENSL